MWLGQKAATRQAREKAVLMKYYCVCRDGQGRDLAWKIMGERRKVATRPPTKALNALCENSPEDRKKLVQLVVRVQLKGPKESKRGWDGG